MEPIRRREITKGGVKLDNFEKIIILLIVGNALAIFRFVFFSRFKRRQVIFSIVTLNLIFILGFIAYSNGIILSERDTISLIILLIILLTTVFLIINKRE